MKHTTHCKMLRNGEINQQQSYTFEQRTKSLSITESATVEGQNGLLINCLFSISPKGYSDISLSIMRNGTVSHKLEFAHSNSNISTMIVNGTSSTVELNEEMLLLDGPNPMFDYANAMYLMGMQNMETCTRTVHALDWNTGEFYPMEYEFSKKDNIISVNKKDIGITGEILLDETEGYIKEASYSNGEHYYFGDSN